MSVIDEIKDERNIKNLFVKVSYIPDISLPVVEYALFSYHGGESDTLVGKPRIADIPKFVRTFDPYDNKVIVKGSYKIKLHNQDGELTEFFENNFFLNQEVTIGISPNLVLDSPLNFYNIAKARIDTITVDDYIEISLKEVNLLEIEPVIPYDFHVGNVTAEAKTKGKPFVLGKNNLHSCETINALDTDQFWEVGTTASVVESFNKDNGDYFVLECSTYTGAKNLRNLCSPGLTIFIGDDRVNGYTFIKVEACDPDKNRFHFSPGYAAKSTANAFGALYAQGQRSHIKNTRWLVSSNKESLKYSAPFTTMNINDFADYNIMYLSGDWSFLEVDDIVWIEWKDGSCPSYMISLQEKFKCPIKVKEVGYDETEGKWYIKSSNDYKLPYRWQQANGVSPTEATTLFQVSYYYVNRINIQNTNNLDPSKEYLEQSRSYVKLKCGNSDNIIASGYTKAFLNKFTTVGGYKYFIFFEAKVAGTAGNSIKVSFVHNATLVPALGSETLTYSSGTWIVTMNNTLTTTGRIKQLFDTWAGSPSMDVNVTVGNPYYTSSTKQIMTQTFADTNLAGGLNCNGCLLLNVTMNRDEYYGKSGSWSTWGTTDTIERNFSRTLGIYFLIGAETDADVPSFIKNCDKYLAISLGYSVYTASEVADLVRLAMSSLEFWDTTSQSPMLLTDTYFEKLATNPLYDKTDTLIIRNLSPSNIKMNLEFYSLGSTFEIIEENNSYNYIADQDITAGNHYIDLDYIGCTLGAGKLVRTDSQGQFVLDGNLFPYSGLSDRQPNFSLRYYQQTDDDSFEVPEAGVMVLNPNLVKNISPSDSYARNAMNKVCLVAITFEDPSPTLIGDAFYIQTPENNPDKSINGDGGSNSTDGNNKVNENALHLYEPQGLIASEPLLVYYKDEFCNVGKLLEQLLTVVYGLDNTQYSQTDLDILKNTTTPDLRRKFFTYHRSTEAKKLYENINDFLVTFGLCAFIDTNGVIRIQRLSLVNHLQDTTYPINYFSHFKYQKKTTLPQYSRVETSFNYENGKYASTNTFINDFIEGSFVNIINPKKINSKLMKDIFSDEEENGYEFKEIFYNKYMEKIVTVEVALPMEYITQELNQLFYFTNHPDLLETDYFILYEIQTDFNSVIYKLIKVNTSELNMLITDAGDEITTEDEFILEY